MTATPATLAAPDDFARAFATAIGARDATALAAICAADADMLSLTGAWCEGRAAIKATMAAELAGALARVRLVTGRSSLRPLAPGVVALTQRYVFSGITDADGRDAGRVAVILRAVLVAGPDGWLAVTLALSPVAG